MYITFSINHKWLGNLSVYSLWFGKSDRQTGRQADRQTAGRPADRQTGRRVDRQTGSQSDRQTGNSRRIGHQDKFGKGTRNERIQKLNNFLSLSRPQLRISKETTFFSAGEFRLHPSHPPSVKTAVHCKKKICRFPVLSRYDINQTHPCRKLFKYSRP